MSAQRTDYVVTYVADGGKQRKRSFWIEADAHAFARSSNASRIEKQTVEVIWEQEAVGETDTAEPWAQSS